MAVRVAGCDPGTSSLDILVLDDGRVADQVRFAPDALRADPASPAAWLRGRGPFDRIAGPSGYGLPLVPASACTDDQLDLMALVRPDERGRAGGVAGFSAVVRAFRDSGLPVVFLPGVVHLPTVPARRKVNKIDLGTPDKLSVAALALTHLGREPFCLVELGSAFTACVVASDGVVVDGLGGTSGPMGWRSGGGWDGEAAYWRSPLAKRDLFAGGAADWGAVGAAAFGEGVVKAVAGLRAVTAFAAVVLSGRLLEEQPEVVRRLRDAFAAGGRCVDLPGLPGAWVKHAAQGAAVLADGLAGGRYADLVGRMRLGEARGSVLDWLAPPG